MAILSGPILFGLAAGTASANVISWNFDNYGTINNTSVANANRAGVILSSNWNNSYFRFNQSLNEVYLMDNLNNSTPVNCILSGNSGYSIQLSHPGQDANGSFNRELLNGYINANTAETIKLTGIPYSQYNIYVYFSSDVSGRTGTVSIGSKTYYYQTLGPASISGANATLTQTLATSATYPAANYAVFTGLTGSTQVITNLIPSYGGIAGFQIVDLSPAPTPMSSLTITNGVQKYASLANTAVTLSNKCELWVTNSVMPLSNNVINLNSVDAWLFLPNVKPSSLPLNQILVNGAAVAEDFNCRAVQYGQNGTVVIPQASNFQPLTVYTGAEFTGAATSYNQWTYYTGNTYTNVSSFRLKRGYQAVIATSANGVSSSRCYTAQDGDLEIGVLPTALDRQVRFIYVTPWHWVSKKGSCDIAPAELNAQWHYNWNISQLSPSRNYEYVAIKQQPYWPGLDMNYMKSIGVNHLSGYNEPNNPVEDAYKNLAPQGSVSDAVARMPELLGTGLRLGAPAVTDGGYSWIVDFVNQADAAGYRLDYVPVHYYRSYGNNAYTQGAVDNLYSYLKGIYDAVKRPIWLTEFNNGANWTTDADPTFDQNKNIIEGMINMMDKAPWIERYSVYSAVEEVRQVYYNAGGYTPMGLMYRDHAAPLAHLQAMPDNGTRGIAQFLFQTNVWDSSGYYNNGMAIGLPGYTNGHAAGSQAIVLDGTNSYVQLPANIAKGSSFTFAAWVYWNGGGAQQRFFDFGAVSTLQSGDPNQYMYFTPNSSGSNMRFGITTGSWQNEQSVQTSPLPANSWQHVAVTLNGTTAILYLNGTQVASASVSLTPAAFNPTRNYLGQSQWSSDSMFNGKLDDVEIADYAMSAAQISSLYSSGPNPAYVSGVWTNNASGNWSTSANWKGGIIPNGVGRMADFSTIDITADRTVTLDSVRTNGGLRFGDMSGGQNWIINGANTLTLDGGGGNAAPIEVRQNTATISAPLAGTTGFMKTGLGTLNLSGANNSFNGSMRMNGGAVWVTAGSNTLAGASLAWGSSGSIAGTLNILGAGGFNSTAWITVFDGQNATVSGAGTVNVINGTLNAEGNLILGFAGSGTGSMNISSGSTVNVASTTKRSLVMNQWDTAKGILILNGGTLNLNANSDIRFSTGSYGPGASVGQSTLTLNSGAVVGGSGSVIDLNNNADNAVNNTLNLNGGTLTIGGIVSGKANGTRVVNFNGGTLKASVSSATFFASGAASAANVKSGGATIDTDGKNITVGQPLLAAGGGLIKNGDGKLTLSGANTYAGSTLINAGTLALTAAWVGSSPDIIVAGGATLDVTGLGVSLTGSQALFGSGTNAGSISTVAGSRIYAGTDGGYGTNTFKNDLTFAAGALAYFDVGASHNGPNDLIVVGGTLSANGNDIHLKAPSASENLEAADYVLFSVPNAVISGSFNATPNWDVAPANADNFSIVTSNNTVVMHYTASGPSGSSQLTNSITTGGTSLQLSWGSGWTLQRQTNSPGKGLGTNWETYVDGILGVTGTNILLDKTNGSVFYRLVYP